MEELLDSFNEEQREAVTSTEGYVRVIAGAGSGKTRALSHRFAFLVQVMGVLPSHILCVTFTNKAANEMRQRIHLLTGDDDTGLINTFHGFCVHVLREDSNIVQYPKHFLVLDNSDIDAMLKVIYEERGLSLRDFTFSRARDMIEMRKTLRDPEYYRDVISMTSEELRRKYEKSTAKDDIIFYGYLFQQKKCFGLDYNDLIVFVLTIFEMSEEVRDKWQRRLEYIMIDEFQDIDPLQYKLMRVLCAYHRNLFVVGDPDQTIYTWRGAAVKYLLDFDQEFKPCQTIVMAKNYRSTPEILEVVNSLIDKNQERIKKELEPILPNGEKPLYFQGESPEKEAEWVAKKIGSMHAGGVRYRDMAILYRAHYVTRSIEDALLKAEIPYRIYSGVQFFDRAEIKDALSYLRLLVHRDDLAFVRVANIPKRNLGDRRMAFLRNYAEQNHCPQYEALERNIDQELFRSTKARELIKLVEELGAEVATKSVSETMRDILERSGYEMMLRTEGSQERLDNLAELRQAIYDFETTNGEESSAEAYLAQAALYTSRDADTKMADRVKLMTVHTAKGLEFPYVFLVALNEGNFPSKKTKSKEGMEEERRLAFVAMTRAERGLLLSSSGGIDYMGGARYASRFLLDIQKESLDYVVPRTERFEQEIRAYVKSQTPMEERKREEGEERLKEGDRVRHPILGEGEIVTIDRDNKAYEVKFDRVLTTRMVSFRVVMQKIN